MKKTYIKPNTIQVVIAITHPLLTTSTVEVKSESYNSETMTDLSRRGNGFWDEEE